MTDVLTALGIAAAVWTVLSAVFTYLMSIWFRHIRE